MVALGQRACALTGGLGGESRCYREINACLIYFKN